jgi:hypothetical protein
MVDRDRTSKRGRRYTMTGIADIRSRRMRRTLGKSDTARFMAIDAHAGNNLRMVDGEGSESCRRYRVTQFATIAGLRMGQRFTDGGGRCRIMTSDASRGNAGMVNGHRTCTNEGGWRYAMAVVAFIRGHGMCWTFPYRNTTRYMTVHAHSHIDLGMIHNIGGKFGGRN